MNILLPLFYALLVVTGQMQEPAPQQSMPDEAAEKKKAIFYSSVFSHSTDAMATAACNADATLIDSGAGPFGSPFKNCSSVGSFYTLEVQNNSTTKATNSGYKINWGDGTPSQTFTTLDKVTHTYQSRGAFTLTFTVTDNSGCETSREYRVFNLSNPGFAVGNPGSTTACLTPTSPTITFSFPVSAIESNPPTTVYTFSFDDGSAPEVYTHEQMMALKKITHTFVKSSCDMPNQYFTISGVAEYPCGSTTMRTPGSVEGIVINKSTNADFNIAGGPLYCAGGTVTLGNATNNPDLCPITFDWSILDGQEGVDWEFVEGSRSAPGVKIRFIKAGSYRIKLATFTAGCGQDEVVKEIIIREAANAAFDYTLDKGTSCEDLLVSTINNSTGYNLTYEWSIKYGNNNAAQPNDYTFISGTLTSATPQFLLKRIGKYSITLKSSNGCSTKSITKEVTVKGTPTVAFKSTTAQNCGPFILDYNNALNINANNGTISKYTWSVDNGASFSGGTNSNSAEPKINFPATGTYRVRVSIMNECGSSSTATQTVTVHPLPAAPVVDGLTVCQNDRPTLTVKSPVAGETYRWYNQATGGTALGTGISFTAPDPLTAETTTFYVEAVNDKDCASVLPRTGVVVKALTAVTGNTITTTKTVYCEGSIPEKFIGGEPAGGGGAPYTFLWEVSTNGVDFTGAPGVNTEKDYTPTKALGKTNTVFRRKVFNNPCQTVTSNEVELKVIPTPQKPVLQNQNVCYNQSATLEISNVQQDVNYTWYDAPAGGNIVATGTSHTLTAIRNNTTLYVEAVSAMTPACQQPERAAVTVSVTPAIVGGTQIASPASVVCYNSSPGQLTGAAPTGGTGTYTYTWYSSISSSSDGFVEVYNGPVANYTTSALTQRTWFKRVAKSGSCEVTSNILMIDVEDLPAAPTVQGITTICYGSSTTLTATAPGGIYTWYTKEGAKLQEGVSFTSPSLETTTTYLVSAKSGLGCESPKTAITIYVAPALANNNISGEQTVCSGSSVLALSGSLPIGGDGTNYTYFWEYSTDEGTTYQAAPGNNTLQDYTPEGTFTNNTWFRRKVSSAPCAEVISNEVKITVVPLPDVPVVQSTQACYGSKVTLAVENPVNGVKYRWYDASGAVVKNGNTYDTPILTSTSNYAVEAILDNASACVSSTRTAVTVTVVPAMMGGDIINTPKPVVCKGSSPGALSGDAPTGGIGTYTYQWYASTTSNPYAFNEIENATDQAYTPQNMQETTWYKREVSSSTCKKESIVIRVVVEAVPEAPTVQGIREVCYGGSTVLTAQGQGGSFNWYDENNVQIHTGTAPYYGQNLTRSRTFYVEAESATGCTSPRTEVHVTVVPVLTNTISVDKTICQNEDPGTIGGVLSGGNGPDSYKIRWEYSSGGSAFTAAPSINNEPSYSPGPLSVTTTYRRVVESGDCEQRSNSVTITIANTIAGNTISGGGTICAGGSPGTLTGNGSTGFSYQWYASTTSATTGFQPISVNGTNRDYTPAALLETTWFQRKITSGNCSSMSNTILVTVEKVITNNSIRTSVTEVCMGGKPGTITGEEVRGGNGSPTYLWQWTKVSEPGNYKPAPGANTGKDYVPNPNDPALNLTEAIYFRRIATAGLCSPSKSNEILISVIPTVVNEITTASNTLCINEAPAQFVSATPISGGKPGNYTYRWERSLNGGVWGAVANTVDYTPTDGLAAGTWQYRRWIGSGGCSETLSNVLTIKVNPAIKGNQLATVAPVCVGTTVTFTGTGNITGGDNINYDYVWEKSLNGTTYFTLTGEKKDKLAIPVTERSWYRRTVKSGNCVSTSDPIEVQVQEQISVQITGAQSVCLGTSLTKLTVTKLTGGGNSNKIQWMKSDTEGGVYTAIPGATANEYLPTAVTRPTWFKVKVTGSACQDGWSNAVKVEFYPAIVNRIGDSQTICQGGAALVIGSTQTITGGAGADSYTFQWLSSTNGTNFNIITGAPNADSYTPQNVTKRTWFKRVIYSAGCSNESDAVEINVQTPPVNKISIANNHICSGTIPDRITSETLGGTSEPYTFMWQQSTDGVTYRTISGAVDATYQPLALTRTTWFKRIVRSEVCGEITGNDNVVRIQVDQPIKDNFIVTKPAAVCVGQAIPELKGSNPTGGNGSPTYLWMASVQGETTGFAPAPGENRGQHYQPRNVERPTWYKRVVYAAPCQEHESPVVKLEVAPQPDMPTAEAVTACLGSSATLTAKAAATGDLLQWYDAPTGGKLIGTGTTYTSAKLYNNTSFYVQATNQSNCVSPNRLEVKVQVVQPKAEASEDVTVVEGKAVEIWAKGGVSYSWSPMAGLTDPTSATPKASPKETTTYTVTVTTAEGCTASAQVTVTVSPRVQAANVITPNGDNKNDRFKIMNIENYPDCRVEIFSRWGEKVFESKGYTELQEWDGTRNGQQLPMAAYYYIIHLNNGEEPISGSVTLIR